MNLTAKTLDNVVIERSLIQSSTGCYVFVKTKTTKAIYNNGLLLAQVEWISGLADENGLPTNDFLFAKQPIFFSNNKRRALTALSLKLGRKAKTDELTQVKEFILDNSPFITLANPRLYLYEVGITGLQDEKPCIVKGFDNITFEMYEQLAQLHGAKNLTVKVKPMGV